MASSWKQMIERGIAMLFGDAPSRKKPSQRKKKPASKTITTTPGAPRSIHRVRQELDDSCGVAVVAMFARVSHDEAFAVMFPKPKKFHGTSYTDVKRGLDHFGVKHGGKIARFRSWEQIPATALTKVKWTDRNGTVGYHWVIFQKRPSGVWHVIDPDPISRKTQRLSERDLAEYTGVTYLMVQAIAPST